MDEITSSTITTAHEESYSNGKTIGILVNWEEDGKKIESFPYYFRMTDQGGMYIFFDTIVDMNDYMLYGDDKVKRGYMKEDKFDTFYDDGVEGVFTDQLEWLD